MLYLWDVEETIFLTTYIATVRYAVMATYTQTVHKPFVRPSRTYDYLYGETGCRENVCKERRDVESGEGGCIYMHQNRRVVDKEYMLQWDTLLWLFRAHKYRCQTRPFLPPIYCAGFHGNVPLNGAYSLS